MAGSHTVFFERIEPYPLMEFFPKCLNSVTKKYLSLKELKPVNSCVRDQDATTVSKA